MAPLSIRTRQERTRHPRCLTANLHPQVSAALDAAAGERRDGKILFKIDPELP